LSTILEEKAQRITANMSLIEKIEKLMNNYESHFNLINLLDISNQLGLSTNSLRNQLLKENTTFREIFNNFKLKKSKHMIKDGFSVKAISYHLGYSEPSSFVRWFVSQTKLTPTSFKLNTLLKS
jgi:AraC-like DNA-binding protein